MVPLLVVQSQGLVIAGTEIIPKIPENYPQDGGTACRNGTMMVCQSPFIRPVTSWENTFGLGKNSYRNGIIAAMSEFYFSVIGKSFRNR
jgi:hypothetical protein